MQKHPVSIQKLNSAVIDQIAAGEVLERPAHLVKELVENALDAGARSIEIQFSDGGLFVSIKDDGCGIPPKELSLALARHATSKIKQAGDLFSIHTYGFRGEALASIASVSHLLIVSKTPNSDQAYRLKSVFGKEFQIEAVGGVQGTTITVDRLFQNVPARLKFLKSQAVETMAVKNVILSQALARPDVSFKVLHKGRMLFHWRAEESFKKRAESALQLQKLYTDKSETNGIAVEVVLSPPNQTAKSSKKMWFFVNRRPVEDKVLYGAVMSAHRNLLMHGEYPIAVLYVECPPAEVDVNVHPTKSQVRFRSPSRIFRAVQNTVRTLLEKSPWLEQLTPFTPSSPNSQKKDIVHQTSLHLDSAKQERSRFEFKPQENKNTELSVTEEPPIPQKTFTPPKHTPTPPYKKEFSKPQQTAAQSVKDAEHLKSPKVFSSLKILAQAHRTYLICQSEKSIVFVDQHAAHERILFEKLMHFCKKGGLEKQKKLISSQFEMDPAEVTAVQSMQNSFKSLGIELEFKKPNIVSILSSPLFIKESSLEKSIKQLAHQNIHSSASFEAESIVAEVMASLACHSAIRAGQTLTVADMESLLSQMDEFSFSSFCPHGRPVFVEYPLSRLERDFGRIV